MFSNIYDGKKVLVTGHTGFKGTWLCKWLLDLGAVTVGYSNSRPSDPCMFDVLGMKSLMRSYDGDLRDLANLKEVISSERPDFVFHLGAQAIVSKSYEDPIETISTNVMGMANVMECLRHVDWPLTAILITSDKSYENVEWVWGYKETDHLGGKDIYSGSKGAADLVFKSFFQSFFLDHSYVTCAVARAGNVIGGGDWARDRIVVDAVTAWAQSKSVKVRCPSATRPWQHVLEPLSGYLSLGEKLQKKLECNGEAFNFGPKAERNYTVLELLDSLDASWGLSRSEAPYEVIDKMPFNEASLLKLNCDKALFAMDWEATLGYRETVKMTAEWYVGYYSGSDEMLQLTSRQIAEYVELALSRKLKWAIA